jgi:hypothetical protein
MKGHEHCGKIMSTRRLPRHYFLMQNDPTVALARMGKKKSQDFSVLHRSLQQEQEGTGLLLSLLLSIISHLVDKSGL